MKSKRISEEQMKYIAGQALELLESVDVNDLVERYHGELADEWLRIRGELRDAEDMDDTDRALAVEMLAEYLFD